MQPEWLRSSALSLASPALARARVAIDAAARRLAAGADVPWSAAVANALLAPLERDVHALCERTIVLELHVARMLGTVGDGKAAPADGFAQRLRTAAGREALLAEYGVLARLLAARAAAWELSAIELLERLAADASRLGDIAERPGPLGELETVVRLGDSHDGARGVLGVRFSRAGRIVYKPRDLRPEGCFAQLVDWCAAEGVDGLPRVPAMLCRDGYGWVRFERPAACAEKREVRSFYEALGATLAMLHGLAAVDVHYENLVACGPEPCLVDLECLLHPRIGGANADAIDPARGERSAASVLRIGLLPVADVAYGADLSGMAGATGDEPVETQAWVGMDGDAPRLAATRTRARGGPHLPVLDGRVAVASDHIADVDRGFARTYRLLVRGRAELLRPDGVMGQLASAPMRVLLRHSKRYGGVLFASAHPDALRDEAGHRAVLAHLRLGLDSRPDLARVIDAELHDLGACDFPRFTTLPGSRDVRHRAHGDIAGVLGEGNGMDPKTALGRLGERDLERQRTAIRRALTAGAR